MTDLAYAAAPLDFLKSTHRPLILFAPDDQDTALFQQRKEISQHLQGFLERDMVGIVMVNETSHLDFLPEPLVLKKPFQPEQLPAAALQNTYHIPPDSFSLILIGKDGHEKDRWSEPVDMQEIFSVIDAMPMRRQEIRDRKK